MNTNVCEQVSLEKEAVLAAPALLLVKFVEVKLFQKLVQVWMLAEDEDQHFLLVPGTGFETEPVLHAHPGAQRSCSL
jgi:hypothetical protein